MKKLFVTFLFIYFLFSLCESLLYEQKIKDLNQEIQYQKDKVDYIKRQCTFLLNQR